MTKEKLSFAEARRIFVKALKVSVKTRSVASIVVNLLGFPMAFLPMLVSVWVRNFSNEIQSAYGKGEALISSVLGVFAILAALYVVQLLWNTLRDYFTRLDELGAMSFMKERILRCTCEVQYKYIENFDDFKERIRFVDTDAGKRVAASMTGLIAWVQNIITFVSIIAVLWSVDIWIVVILVGACIPAVVFAYFQKDEEYISKTKFGVYEYLMAIAYFFEATWPNSINEIRFFGIYPWLKQKNIDMFKRYIKRKNAMTRKHVLYNSLADLFRSCVYLFILLITARHIFDNPAIGIGAFMLVFTMAGQLQTVTAQIFIAMAQFVSDAAYMKDFFYIDELDYEKREANATPRDKYAIDFNDVSFTYPNTEREVLHNLNVHIKEGEKVAIVGENGSGKSTFVALLCALFEPNDGKITMGGEDIHMHLSKTRKTLSAVFQDFARYEASIRENITVSDNRSTTDTELQSLTQSTGAWEFIEPQPNGVDEVVGSFSATGNNLSGGQWQKIALTRCAYRDTAKVMILDEPTAALDPLAEADLYRNFANLTGDRTTILISHRLGITQLVDRILVFDDGRIVEDGTHSELLQRNGLYAKMYQAQALWYE
jgi:ABC-type multidrug transport system fused ATPase/permease subunit